MILKRRAVIVTIISVLLISILVLATTIYVHRQSASSLDWVNNTSPRPTIGTYDPNQSVLLSAIAISEKDNVNPNHIKIIKVIAIHPGEWSVSYKFKNKAGVWTPIVGNYEALVIRPFTGSIYAVHDKRSANSNNSKKRTVSNVVLAKSKISWQYAGSNGSWYQIYGVKSNGFKIKYYDNANAEWYQATYVWKKGKFEQSSLDAVSPK